MDIWKNKEQILQGITNTLIRDEFIESIAKERLAICHTCPSLSTDCKPLIYECCSLCGCSLKFKTRSMSDACPKEKWLAINVNK